jgi:hypothetical protein
MSKPFKMLRGNRILISKPEVKESAIELSEKDKALIEAELRKTWSQLEVYAVGEAVKEIYAGDKVYVRVTALELAEKIEIDGQMKFLIHEQDIAIVW